MIRTAALVFTFGLAGCSRSAEPSTTDINVAIRPAAQATGESQDTAKLEESADLAEILVARASAPDRPALTADRTFPAPRRRAFPTKLFEPDAITRMSYRLPFTLSSRISKVRPVPPRERVPVELGRGSDQAPSRPTFPIAAGITTRSRDVRIPPALPTLGRPFTERASLDDPTTDFAHATITTPPLKLPNSPAPFLKVTIPDPFELAEQIKPKVPQSAEPGLVPVEVAPERRK